MRYLSFFLVILLTVSVYARPKYVQAKRNGVKIYESKTRDLNESAIKEIDRGKSMEVLSSSGDKYKVDVDGTEGWVEKRLTARASGKEYTFDDAEVTGYLDNPTPIYIVDADNQDKTPVQLDRSFAEALKQNVDMETIKRHAK
ncbi:MAG: hypothetical protein ACOCSE_04080 [Chitinivibrionales bacterium]